MLLTNAMGRGEDRILAGMVGDFYKKQERAPPYPTRTQRILSQLLENHVEVVGVQDELMFLPDNQTVDGLFTRYECLWR